MHPIPGDVVALTYNATGTGSPIVHATEPAESWHRPCFIPTGTLLSGGGHACSLPL